MSYHDLSECTLTPAERLEEAEKIIKILIDNNIELTPKEESFVQGMQTSCSVKQLFWLRDIKDKYL